MLRIQGKQKGNTIAEYSLIGTAVLLASVAMILLVGQNLDTALRGLPGDMRQSIMGAQAFMQLVANERASGTVAGGEAGPGLRTVCTRTRSGSVCVNVPESFASTAGMTSTTGSMGDRLSTREFAQLLLAAASVMDPSDLKRLYNRLVIELALTGQEIAKKEQDLVFICRAGRACEYGIKQEPENELEQMAKNKKDEIKDTANDFNETKEVLDALLVTITVPPSDKQVIEEKSEVINTVASNTDNVEAITSGSNAQTATGASNDICATSSNPTQCTVSTDTSGPSASL